MGLNALVAKAEAAAKREARRRWGPRYFRVRGRTGCGCCVHLIVEREGAEEERWQYELDGRIVEDRQPGEQQPAFDGCSTQEVLGHL